MARFIDRLLAKITPWYDRSEADKKDKEHKEVMERVTEVSVRAKRAIGQYQLADEIYSSGKSFKWIERK